MWTDEVIMQFLNSSFILGKKVCSSANGDGPLTSFAANRPVIRSFRDYSEVRCSIEEI
jgi:hypothetical protein